MEWVSEVAVGSWLRAHLDDPWRDTIHDVVPRDYPAYARILHPATRSRPVDRPWPPYPVAEHRRAWNAFHRAEPEIDTEEVSWGETASALGTELHPLSSWESLVAPGSVDAEHSPLDPAGWSYDPPDEGAMPHPTLSSIARVLTEHTATPDDGYVALWEGFGGLVGHYGDDPARAMLSFGGMLTLAETPEGYTDAPRHRRFLDAIRPDAFRSPLRKPTWQPGLLSDEISLGPRLHLLHRDHLLFRSGIGLFVDSQWARRAPWAEPDHPAHTQTPTMIWPQDRAWVMVSEIDWNCTVVAGSVEAVSALFHAPGLEAFPIPADSSLVDPGELRLG